MWLDVGLQVHVKITFCHGASREPYPHRDTHTLVHQLVAAFGADRCLWGSNFTGADQTAPGFTYEDAFQLFYTHVGLTEEDRAWYECESNAPGSIPETRYGCQHLST